MSTIGAVDSANTVSQTGNIGMQDFLNILLTQLTYQDPLKPMDNKEFMAQLAQFTTLGQTQELNTRIDALLSTQASMQSIGLIGRTVQVDTDSGSQTGTVSALSWAGDTPQLSIKTSTGIALGDFPLSKVTLVR